LKKLYEYGPCFAHSDFGKGFSPRKKNIPTTFQTRQ